MGRRLLALCNIQETYDVRSPRATLTWVRLPPTASRKSAPAASLLTSAMRICLIAAPAPSAPSWIAWTSFSTVLFLRWQRVVSVSIQCGSVLGTTDVRGAKARGVGEVGCSRAERGDVEDDLAAVDVALEVA